MTAGPLAATYKLNELYMQWFAQDEVAELAADVLSSAATLAGSPAACTLPVMMGTPPSPPTITGARKDSPQHIACSSPAHHVGAAVLADAWLAPPAAASVEQQGPAVASVVQQQPPLPLAPSQLSPPKPSPPPAAPPVPRFYARADAAESLAAAQQEMRLMQTLLGSTGLHDGSVLELATLARLLPQLPGGGVPPYLARCVWRHAASIELGDIAAEAALTALHEDAHEDALHEDEDGDGADTARTIVVDDDDDERAEGVHSAAPFTVDERAEAAGRRLVAKGLRVGAFRRFFNAQLAGSGADERLLRCLCGGANAELTAATCRPLVSEVVRQHPSLPFLAADVVYRTHYEATVVHRILFSLDPLRTGRVSAATLRRTGAPLWGALRALSGEGAASDDINCERRFFSYEHFYVIFCKFCELDADGDFELSLEELHRYGGYALSTRAIGRVFVELAGSPREAIEAPNGGISYGAFVYFLLCEEDKASATARSFWFRVLDVDADGVLSADDLRHFYDEQAARLTSLGHEPTDFGHVLCQLTDALNPRLARAAAGAGGGRGRVTRGGITPGDLRRSQMTTLLVHTLCNLTGFLRQETHDAGALREKLESLHMSDFDRWAAREYATLSMDEDEADEAEEPLGPLSRAYAVDASDFAEDEEAEMVDDEDEDDRILRMGGSSRFRQDGSPRFRQDGSSRFRQDGSPRFRQDGSSRFRQDGCTGFRQDGSSRFRQDGSSRFRQDGCTGFRQDEDEDGERLEDADGDVAMLVPPMSGTGSGFGVSNAACEFGGRGGSFGLVRAACANPALLSGSDACEAPF
jgi:serine/threonine-protein phosphatase 2A regulatory subunit B''